MQPSFDAEYNQPDDGPSGENRVITPSLCPFNLSLKARVFTTFFIIVYLLNYIIIIKKRYKHCNKFIQNFEYFYINKNLFLLFFQSKFIYNI